jgi:hypothetical protein
MASIPHRVRLQRVMEHLGLRAERAPFYIDAATLGHRAPGWYWRPPEAEADVFLGHNHVVAEIALYEISKRATAAA